MVSELKWNRLKSWLVERAKRDGGAEGWSGEVKEVTDASACLMYSACSNLIRGGTRALTHDLSRFRLYVFMPSPLEIEARFCSISVAALPSNML